MKAARKTVTATPAIERDILPPLTANEAKNGWTQATLDAFLRGSFADDIAGYRREVFARLSEQQRIAEEAVAKFKAAYDCVDPREKAQLNRLELAAANARAMANLAADRLEAFERVA